VSAGRRPRGHVRNDVQDDPSTRGDCAVDGTQLACPTDLYRRAPVAQ
jgi:hypothetical protein